MPPFGKNGTHGTGDPDDDAPPGGYPSGRFGEEPDERRLPQLSIVPGMLATVVWVLLMLWLASLPGGLLHVPQKPNAAPPSAPR